MSLPSLSSLSSILIRQKRELGELFGFETRNRYEILRPTGGLLGYCAEQQKGVLGFILRQLLGHWRSFTLYIFNSDRQIIFRADHPFRFYFSEIKVYSEKTQEYMGCIKRRFHIFHTRFDILDKTGQLLFQVKRPLWRFWRFNVYNNSEECARIEKKWSGVLYETFTDKDNFAINFLAPQLNDHQKWLLVLAGVFVDLMYFERKAGR